jgi:hypothetical protein
LHTAMLMVSQFREYLEVGRQSSISRDTRSKS